MTDRFMIDDAGELFDLTNNKFVEYGNEVLDLLNVLNDENKQLKQQLEDITLNWTQNHTNFDKDELYLKDNNTEITLKNNNLLISVCIPQIQEHFKFHYIVTGRRLEREYILTEKYEDEKCHNDAIRQLQKCQEQKIELIEKIKKLKKELHLQHMSSMFSTVKSFKGDVSKRYRYDEERDMIYDTANRYGSYHKVLDKKEIVMLLNEYETVLNKELKE